MKLKKHPFILFELLIAIALLTLVAFPFIDLPFLFLKDQNSTLVQMELERLAAKTDIETKAKLYQNIYPFEILTREKKPSAPDLEETIELSLPPNTKQKFKKEIRFWSKKKAEDKEAFLINIETIFIQSKHKKVKYNSEVMIKQITKK